MYREEKGDKAEKIKKCWTKSANKEKVNANGEADGETVRRSPNKFKKTFLWLCGIKTTETPKYTIDTSIEENPFWKTVCDVNAVIAISVCGFLYTFFNKYVE